MLAADRPDGQLTDRQFVADVDRPAWRSQLGSGLRIGVEHSTWVPLEQRRQPVTVDVIGVLMGDQDCRQTGDSLEAVRERTGIKKQARSTELGEKAGMPEMRQLHVYDCALMAAIPIRVFLAALLVAGNLVIAVTVATSGWSEPETCPPVCDQIPGTAWIDRRAVPLNSVYGWPALAGVATAVTGTTPRFRFEQVCATPAFPQDSRDATVAARATVVHPDGQWQLQAQILHWRGDTARGGAIAASVFGTAVAALRACQLGAPTQSPSITDDEPTRMAAVISGPVIVHTYLVAHIASSTISELTLWSSGPPKVEWPVVADSAVLDAMTAPLCAAYISSCG